MGRAFPVSSTQTVLCGKPLVLLLQKSKAGGNQFIERPPSRQPPKSTIRETTGNNMLGKAGQFCAPMPVRFWTLPATEVLRHLAQTSAISAHAPDRVCFGRANLNCTEARLQSPSLVSVERICGIIRKSAANKKKSLPGSTGHSTTGASTPTDFAADISFRSSEDSGNWVRSASSRYMAS